MQRGRRKKLIASVAMVLWMVTFTGWTIAAEEEKKAEAPAEAPKAEARPAAPGAPAAAAPAPKVPGYFGATLDDPKKPSPWPDPTGGASGVWATPAGDS